MGWLHFKKKKKKRCMYVCMYVGPGGEVVWVLGS